MVDRAGAVEWIAATYNIHRCIGSDDRHDPERIADVIKRLAADIVGLQEVDIDVTRRGWVDQAEVLGRLTGMQVIAGPAVQRPYGRYGNALLTRLEVVDVRRHPVGVQGREPRGILEVDVRERGARARVLNTHFGLKRTERARQVSKLLGLLDGRSPALAIVMGDFNEWRPWAGPLRVLDDRLGRAPRLRTFPSRWPVAALDRIWVSPSRALVRAEVFRGGEARRASDHLPLRVRIALPAAGAGR